MIRAHRDRHRRLFLLLLVILPLLLIAALRARPGPVRLERAIDGIPSAMEPEDRP